MLSSSLRATAAASASSAIDGKLCIYLLSLTFLAVGVHASEFLTVQHKYPRRWTFENDDHLDELSSLQQLRMYGQHFLIGNSAYRSPHRPYAYQLKYRPTNSIPRLFWHKFPHKQQLEPTASPTVEMPTMTPTMTIDETEMPTTTMETTTAVTEMMPMTEMITTTSSTVTSPSSRPFPSKKPTTKPTFPFFTTRTTIMKPPIPLYPLKELLLFGSPIEANIIKKNLQAPKTKGKGFLSLFEVIKFENTKCSVAMSDIRTIEGVCYHDFECKSLGGISTERCAEGVGVCCIFVNGCGDTTGQSIVYFESPNYPNPVRETMMCVLVVNIRKNVKQIRLDFLMFELNRPTNGDCLEDQFIVSGQNLNFDIPVLCGINTGQHIYIHVGNSLEPKIFLSFFSKVSTGGRSFNLKVTQLENNLAPDGCLQFYTETEGVVKSFNYDTDGSIVDNREATYLNNLNYVICMERAKDRCTVTYATDILGGDQLDFQILNKDEGENDLVPDGQAGAGIFNCPDDFIAINHVRLCGERINDGSQNEDFTMHATIRDITAGPIIFPVRSDDEYVGRGFRLVYKQEPCL